MITAYQSGDAFKVEVQDEQKEEAEKFASFFDGIKAYSLIDNDGNIIAVCGYIINENKEGECFALLGKKCGRKMIEFVRFGQKEIPRVMRLYGLKRGLMTVRKGFLAGERLAHLFGFYAVGLLENFYLNNDYQLYERN